MGFFARLGKARAEATRDSVELKKGLSALSKNGRLHARIHLGDATLGQLILPNGAVGNVVDLSYGGLAAVFTTGALQISQATAMIGTLKILDQEVQARTTIVRIAQGGPDLAIGGFCLHHETPATLLFLREFIEPSRHGESIALLAREHRQARYQGEDWHCFRGDGPTDLILQKPKQAVELTEALLTFRMNETYWELALRNGRLKTGQALDTSSGATDPGTSRMASTMDNDARILRSALFILTASPPACRTLTAPLIEQIKTLLLAGRPVQTKEA